MVGCQIEIDWPIGFHVARILAVAVVLLAAVNCCVLLPPVDCGLLLLFYSYGGACIGRWGMLSLM